MDAIFLPTGTPVLVTGITSAGFVMITDGVSIPFWTPSINITIININTKKED